MPSSRNMNFISSSAFWGIIIILFGVSIFLREILHIHFPVMRIVFGCILIYWGIRTITGAHFNFGGEQGNTDGSSTVFDQNKKEYNIIFGSGTVDLFKLEKPESNRKIEMNVVFGNGHLIVNDSLPIRIDMSTAFGSIEAADKSAVLLGSSHYQTSAYKENEPSIRIKASAVFGRLSIESKRW